MQLYSSSMWKQANVIEHMPTRITCPRQLRRDLHTSQFAKRSFSTSVFKKSLKCEASITDTEVSGWLVNSLKLLFSEMQTILFSVVGADTDDGRDASRINICYPNSQHSQNGRNVSPGDTVWVFIG